jgi:hypothetical protein
MRATVTVEPVWVDAAGEVEPAAIAIQMEIDEGNLVAESG